MANCPLCANIRNELTTTSTAQYRFVEALARAAHRPCTPEECQAVDLSPQFLGLVAEELIGTTLGDPPDVDNAARALLGLLRRYCSVLERLDHLPHYSNP